MEQRTDVETAARDERERMRGVEGDRRQDRKDLAVEEAAQPGLLLGRQPIGVRKEDTFLLERGLQHLVPADVEVAHLFARNAVDRVERFRGRLAVGLAGGDPGLRLLLQAGDANLVELREVGVDDRKELHAFHQRVAGVLRLLQDPAVEGEPRQLPIQEEFGSGSASGNFTGHAHSIGHPPRGANLRGARDLAGARRAKAWSVREATRFAPLRGPIERELLAPGLHLDRVARERGLHPGRLVAREAALRDRLPVAPQRAAPAELDPPWEGDS